MIVELAGVPLDRTEGTPMSTAERISRVTPEISPLESAMRVLQRREKERLSLLQLRTVWNAPGPLPFVAQV